jgi:O-antigen/teichoic acid export membrane protein
MFGLVISNSTKCAFWANFVIQIVIGVGQLVAVPVYLKYWGGSDFGRWILILGFVSTLSMLDFGVAGVASNEIIRAMACGDKEKVTRNLKIIKLASKLVFFLMFIIGLFIILYAYLCKGVFYIGQVNFGYSVVGGIFIYSSIMVLFNSVGGVVKSFGGNATFSCVAAFCIFFETSFAPLAAFFGYGIEFSFFGLIIIRFIGFLLLFLIASEQVKDVGNNFCRIEAREWVNIFRKSIASMLVPSAISAQLQVPLLALASSISPQMAAGYSTARTLARVIFQFSYIYPRSVLPKFTKYFSLHDEVETKNIYKKLNYIIYLFIAFGCIVYSFAGPYVFEWWTNKIYVFNYYVFAIIGCAIFFHGYWFILMSLLISINNHSVAAVQCSVITVIFCASLFFVGLTLFKVCILVIVLEILLTIVCIRQCIVFDVKMFNFFARM